MKNLIKELRLQFYAQTNIEIESKAKLKVWQQYAVWLENFQAKELNYEVLKEAKFLRKQIYQVLVMLESAISSRI